jgi:hypothetical protein
MQEKSLIKKNILKYLENKGITKYRFYKETGVTRGILDQNNGMSEENTARIIAYYGDINLEWLLTGKGSMLKQTAPEKPAQHPEKEHKAVDTESEYTNNNQDTQEKKQEQYIEDLRKMIDILNSQLAAKDKQIEKLIEKTLPTRTTMPDVPL